MEPLIIILILLAASVILYKYRYVFSFLRYHLTFKSMKRKVEQPSKTRTDKICSTCGVTMEEGYIIGPSGIYWSRDNLPSMPQSIPFFIPSVGSEPLTLSPGLPYSSITPSLKAYRCRKCGIISVDSRSQDFGIA